MGLPNLNTWTNISIWIKSAASILLNDKEMSQYSAFGNLSLTSSTNTLRLNTTFLQSLLVSPVGSSHIRSLLHVFSEAPKTVMTELLHTN